MIQESVGRRKMNLEIKSTIRIKNWNRIKATQSSINEKNSKIACSANYLRMHYGKKIKIWKENRCQWNTNQCLHTCGLKNGENFAQKIWRYSIQ